MNFLKLFERKIDPNSPQVRHRGDEIWEQEALTKPEILGADKRVIPDGSVQYKSSKGWITVGRVFPHHLDT